MTAPVTLLALPGLLCDSCVWEPQKAALADIAEFLIPDFTHEDSLEAMARTALALCDGPVSVVGHSMGGRAAMELWRIAPERVQRLALLDTGAHPRVEGEEVGRMKLVALAREQGMGALADAWLPPMVHPARTTDDALLEPLRDMVRRKTPDIFANQQNARSTAPMPSRRWPASPCQR